LSQWIVVGPAFPGIEERAAGAALNTGVGWTVVLINGSPVVLLVLAKPTAVSIATIDNRTVKVLDIVPP
jgi:hypothetical protein